MLRLRKKSLCLDLSTGKAHLLTCYPQDVVLDMAWTGKYSKRQFGTGDSGPSITPLINTGTGGLLNEIKGFGRWRPCSDNRQQYIIMQVDWTPQRVSTLIALWNEGLSTAEMGRRLDVTKNAVVGKVHRLGLPKRQSPIRTGGKKKAATTAKTAPKAKISTASVSEKKVITPVNGSNGTKVEKVVKKILPVITGEVISMEMLSHGMCSWPSGEPGTDEFRFCGQSSVDGKPYCAAHCEVAYVRSSKDSKSKGRIAAA